jgi:hypothetical protein
MVSADALTLSTVTMFSSSPSLPMSDTSVSLLDKVRNPATSASGSGSSLCSPLLRHWTTAAGCQPSDTDDTDSLFPKDPTH